MRVIFDRTPGSAVGRSIAAAMSIAKPVFGVCLLFRFPGPLQRNVNKT
jgi:hypothetical protein